jgi:hypothetical protein
MKHLPIKHMPVQALPAERSPIEPAPVTGELQLTTDFPKFRSEASKTTSEAVFATTWKATFETARNRVAGATINPDLISVIFLCIIACLIAANLILRFPDAGLTIEQLSQF